MSFPKRGNRTCSALPADVFRSLREVMAYYYKLVHFRTLVFTLQTTRSYSLCEHERLPAFPKLQPREPERLAVLGCPPVRVYLFSARSSLTIHK